MRLIVGLFLLCTLIMGSYSTRTYPPQEALNILSTIGTKAWSSFNLDNSTQVKRVTKFGVNTDVDSATPEIIAAFGGGFVQSALSAETLNISSTDTDDVATTGTGARTILISCIDEDGLEVSVIANMNGSSTVTTTQTCKFVNRAIVLTAGSSKYNEGTITITQTTSGVTLASIPATYAVTQQLIYYVPADRRCYIDNLVKTTTKLSGSSPKIDYKTLVYSQTQDVIYTTRQDFADSDVNGRLVNPDFKAEQLRPNEIVAVLVSTSTDNTVSSATLELTCKID